MAGLQLRKARVGDHELAYVREGAGEALLLIHGITTSSFIWRNLIPALAQTHEVIAVDLLGCGRSDKPLHVSYSIRNHVEVLHALMEGLGLQRYTLIGHDVGGGIAQRFAVEHPDRVDRVAVLNSVAHDFWPVQPIITMRTPIIRQLAMASLDLGMFKLIVQRGVHHRERVTPELMDCFWEPMRTSAGRKAFLHFAASLDNRDLVGIAEPLRALKMPFLVMRGDQDVYLSRETSVHLHRGIPHSTFVEIPRAGHFLQEDQPGLILQHLTRFLGK